jgi:cytochrome c553
MHRLVDIERALRRWACAASCAALASCGGGQSAAADVAPVVRLPVEVIGPEGYTETVTFRLGADGARATTLYLQCHRCGWRDGTVQSGRDRGAKASVRLNGGAWRDITDANVTLAAADAAYGGLSGGFYATRFTIPIDGGATGNNELQFRFNADDGVSSGYRVLAFNLRDASGKDMLAGSTFVDDDPAQWPVDGNAQDIADGRALWHGRTALRESPLSSRQLRATCADCHAADGRDLKYFNYSSWSIQVRAQFHGLSDVQGRQIAAYVRQLDAPAPATARPWNPPYQPGPGLDAKPASEWSAGAGLSAVLEKDEDMLPYLFTDGTTSDAIARAASIRGTLNMRQLPLPLQFPDWNAWLPDTHPLDLWGDAFTASDASRAYPEAAQSLASGASGLSDGSAVRTIESMLERTWNAAFPSMYGAVPCRSYADAVAKGTVRPSLMDKLPAGRSCEDGLQAVNHWLAVKNWELFQTHRMEEATSALYPYGEKRGWFGRQRNVFEVASHRSSNNSQNFVHQSRALGSYHSNAWYQLQLVLNGGHRDPWTWFPQDWFYTPMYIALNSRDNRQPLALLNTAMHIKMYQNLDMTGPDGRGTDRGPGYNGWWLPFVQPWRFESTIGWEANAKGFPWTQLDEYEPGLRLKVTETLLRQFIVKMKSYPLNALPRQSDPTVIGGDRFEHANYMLPTELPAASQPCFYSCPGQRYQARDFYRAMARFKEMGVDTSLRGEMLDWLELVFPNPANPWDSLR